jgi:hypothetical protein
MSKRWNDDVPTRGVVQRESEGLIKDTIHSLQETIGLLGQVQSLADSIMDEKFGGTQTVIEAEADDGPRTTSGVKETPLSERPLAVQVSWLREEAQQRATRLNYTLSELQQRL